MQAASGKEAEHGGGFLNAYEGLLVAVAVEPYLQMLGFELLRGDIAFVHFAHDEFVEEQAVLPQPLGIATQVGGHEVGIFVAEGEDATGLDTYEWRVFGDEVFELSHVALGIAGGQKQASFRDGGAAALGMIGNDDTVSQTGK